MIEDGMTDRKCLATGFVGTLLVIFLLATALAAQTKSKADLIVSGGTVVSMDAKRTVYEDGAIAVNNDTIVAVGPRSEIEARYVGAQTVNAQGKLVLPGFVNGHTHVPMAFIAKMEYAASRSSCFALKAGKNTS